MNRLARRRDIDGGLAAHASRRARLARGLVVVSALASAVVFLTDAPLSASTSSRTHLLGRSVTGRPIIAVELWSPGASRKVLVVGCVHGNECSGEAITSRLIGERPPAGVDLWVIPNLNPDGAAADTRGNAHGVDLNRNFPWHWRRLGGIFNSGPHPLSEPEARIAYDLISRLHPVVSIWFHQHLNVVDESGGDRRIEARFARLVHLPLVRLTREPGSITTWENQELNGTAFVVELPAGPLDAPSVATFTHAVLTVSAPYQARSPAPPRDRRGGTFRRLKRPR